LNANKIVGMEDLTESKKQELEVVIISAKCMSEQCSNRESKVKNLRA